MKRLIAPVLLVTAGLVLALALAEAGLRLAGFSYPSLFIPDDLAGTRLRPGMEGWQRDEGAAYIRVNSQGYRDREHARAKPPGTFRIVVLGDSFSEALAVPMEAAFWAVLERELQACKAFGGKRVEVMNFGVSGYGTAQELLTLRYRAMSYEPDLALLAFFPSNDVRNNSKVLEAEKMRPFYILRDGRLELDDSFLSDPGYRELKRVDAQRAMLQELRLYQLMRRVRAGRPALHHNAPIAVALANDAGKRHDGAPTLAEPGLDENVFREPDDPAWHDAWTITERLVLAMRDEAEAGGARFLLAVLSSAGSVYPDPVLRKRYAARLGVADLFAPERRLEQLGAKHGFRVLALGPELQRYADAHRAYLHGFANTMLGFGHWNEAGHKLAAEIIARDLCARPLQASSRS